MKIEISLLVIGSLVLFAAVAVLFILKIVMLIRFKKLSAQAESKVRIKSTAVMTNVIWILIFALQMPLQLLNFFNAVKNSDESRQISYLMLLCVWILIIIIDTMNLFLLKSCYLTPDGLINPVASTRWKSEDCQYEIDGETLEIYTKGTKTPCKYKIIENRDELVTMLEENYKLHEEEKAESII